MPEIATTDTGYNNSPRYTPTEPTPESVLLGVFVHGPNLSGAESFCSPTARKVELGEITLEEALKEIAEFGERLATVAQEGARV